MGAVEDGGGSPFYRGRRWLGGGARRRPTGVEVVAVMVTLKSGRYQSGGPGVNE
jgi:hypothetical protein